MEHLKVVGRCLAVALALAATLSLASITGAQEQDVRIAAQRLADGRTAFALDVNGERQIPRVNKFPTDATVGRWLYSSPVSVPPAGADDEPTDDGAGDQLTNATDEEKSVRITAKLLADGRIEFGLQVDLDGEWSSTVLPDRRFFPANVTVGRWLRSSVLDLSSAEPTVATPPFTPVLVDSPVIVRRADLDGYSWTGLEPSLYYNTEADPLTDELWTFVNMVTATDDGLYDTIRLQVSCRDGEVEVLLWEESLPYQPSDRYLRAQWRVDGQEVVEERWSHYSGSDDGTSPSARFATALRTADRVVVRLSFYSRTITAVFEDVGDLFRTPVQPNLDHCGEY